MPWDTIWKTVQSLHLLKDLGVEMVLEIVKAVLDNSGPPVRRGVRRWRHCSLLLEHTALLPGSTELLAEMFEGGRVERTGVPIWARGFSIGSAASAAGNWHLAFDLVVRASA